MTSDVQRATEEVAQEFATGKPILCITHKYRDQRGEFIHFFRLLRNDMYSSIVLDVNEQIRTLFPPESLVWVWRTREGGTQFREATCDNEDARKEYEIAKRKLKNTPDFSSADSDLEFSDGQQRLHCISRMIN